MVIESNAAITPLEKKNLKTFLGFERYVNTRPLRYRCNALPTELSNSDESGHEQLGTFLHL